MWGGHMKSYTMEDSFTVAEDATLLSGRIADHLGSVGLRPHRTQTGIEVRAGSDTLFRLFGAFLSFKRFPVGLEVIVRSDAEGARVMSSAYDRLGWYLTKKLFWGEGDLNARLTDLLNEVRTGAGQPLLSQRAAAFSPTRADDMVGRLMKRIDSIRSLILVCVLVFAAAFGLSLLAIWLLPAGEVIGNVLRTSAAVISALLILAYANRQTSSSPRRPRK
jgi:hypothetical protein